MKSIDIEATGKRIKEIRLNLTKKKTTLEDFGKMIYPPADKGVVGRWEKGINLPNKERLEQIAELGNVTVEYLLYGKELNGYGEKIKQIRLENGYSVEKFAKRIGVSIEELINYENENSLPKKSTFEIIADLEGTTVDNILWNVPLEVALPIKKQFEKTQQLIEKYLSEEERAKSEWFFSAIDTLRMIQLGNEQDKQIFESVNSIIGSLLYLASTEPDAIYPKEAAELQLQLDKSIEKIESNLKILKKLTLEQRI